MRSITSIFIIPRLQTNNYIGKAMTQRFVREQELLTLPEHMSSPPLFSGVRVTRSFMCMFCRSLSVLLYFFFWPLCYLFIFDIRILITPLVSSNSSDCLFGILSSSFVTNTEQFLTQILFNLLRSMFTSYIVYVCLYAY